MKKVFSLFAVLFAVVAVSCGPNDEPESPSDVAVTSVSLSQAAVTLEPGGTVSLTAIVNPANATNKSVTWSSSNQVVATVDNGTVKALSQGTATITATSGDKKATCEVTVQIPREARIREILMEFYNAMDGPNWTQKENWGSNEPLNKWQGVEYSSRMLSLDFFYVGLKGNIPEIIGELTELVSFKIVEPGITGTLPQSFSKLTNLEELVIENTAMTSLPDFFARFARLVSVSIAGNKNMSGPLPESLGNSNRLVQLFVFGNGFTGTLPESWARHGDYMNLSGNNLSGAIPDAYLVGDNLSKKLINVLLQDGEGFDISSIDIPGYWPKMSVTDMITGNKFNFADVVKKNKYTVYLEWAPWCPYSKVLMPQLVDYYKKYHQDGLEIIATVMNSEDGSLWNNYDTQKQSIIDKGYDTWYNFFFLEMQEIELMTHPSSTPQAEVYDSEGNTIFSGFFRFKDPAQGRYNHPASTELIPFLETLFGPAGEEEYTSTDYSKDGEVMTLQKATFGKGINLVFMGDAYVDKDMGKGGLYETLMRQSMEEFFKIEPYKTFRDRFNVYAVKVVSKNGKTGVGYSTALGTAATYTSITAGNIDMCYEYALMVPGIKDDKNLLIGVLVNSVSVRGVTSMSDTRQSGVAFYGSSYNESDAFGVTIRHEAGGHGFAFLDDEYFNIQTEPTADHIAHRKSMYEKYGWYANVDFTIDPAKVKWSAFLTDERYKDEVGIFEGGSLYSKGAYRPTIHSMMNDNYEYFNAPSRWAIYKRIMELSGEEASFEKFLEYDAVNRE